MPSGYDLSSNQLYADTTPQCLTSGIPCVFPVSILGFSMDVLEQDTQEIKSASVYVGPKNVGLFGPHGVGHWPMRMGGDE